MRVGVIVLLLFSFLSNINAQGDHIDIIKFRRQKYAIGISPMAMLNAYRAIQINQDYTVNDRMSVSLETGYIFNSFLDYDNVRGYRLRAELEFLLIRGKDSALKSGVFFNHRNTWNNNEIIRNHPTENYREIIPYKMNRRLLGYGVFLGLIFANDYDYTFAIDWGIGGGILKVSTDREIPDIFVFEEFFPQYRNVGSYKIPILFMNLSFSYNLAFHNQIYTEY